jgi:hypothetical protein
MLGSFSRLGGPGRRRGREDEMITEGCSINLPIAPKLNNSHLNYMKFFFVSGS